MSKPRVAINGFGRIGRLTFRANLIQDLVDIVAINDPGEFHQMAHLVKYDSSYGTLDAEIEVKDDHMIVNGKKIHISNIMDPATLPWKELDIDIVLECTGVFTERDGAGKHLAAGAKRVVISAPSKDADVTLCMGVNEEKYDPTKHVIISNASCTTGALAPVAKVIDENFEIVRGMMTTAHSYTGDQMLLDNAHKKDWRRARAAGLSMIPTSTGAAKAIGEVLPQLKGKMDGVAIRVPTPTVSLVDVVFEVKKETTKEEVNAALTKAAENSMKGVLAVSSEPLVSCDFKGNPHSSIVDAELTNVIGSNMIKVMTWYDNEWGYSCRLNEMAAYVGTKD